MTSKVILKLGASRTLEGASDTGTLAHSGVCTSTYLNGVTGSNRLCGGFGGAVACQYPIHFLTRHPRPTHLEQDPRSPTLRRPRTSSAVSTCLLGRAGAGWLTES